MPIPRVCLCAQPRSGSSMMMRVLQAGGLVIDYVERTNDSTSLAIMRQPYGFFENREAILANNYVNSFKLLDPTKFADVPTDYKFIFIDRNLTAIINSWKAIIDAYNNLTSSPLTYNQKIEIATQRNTDWNSILAANPNLFLKLDYDVVATDPAAMANSVAQYINTTEFTFDEASAAAAFDLTLYINRN